MSDTLAAAVHAAVRALREGGLDTPERDARALAAKATGLPADRITLEGGRALSAAEHKQLLALVARRLAHEPVAQIIGHRAFWGRDFEVTRAVLDPRPETETIIALALEQPAPRRVLDLGTGSGCLALTLAAEWPGARVSATDISADALDVAQRNAARLGVAERIDFLQGPWFGPVQGSFDLIVSNPPYIPEAEVATLSPDVRKWEPRAALTPGGDGLSAYREIAAGLREHLAAGGRALFEFGLGQGPALTRIFTEQTAATVRLHDDLSGRARVVEVQF